MSPVKETKILQMYRANLRELRASVPCVTAGRLAAHMGVSRSTAKKYLELNVANGYLQAYDFTHVNGQTATAYIPMKWKA